MPSEAALAGIQLNGLAWKAQLPIKAFIPVVTDITDEQAPEFGKAIARQLDKHSFNIGLIISEPLLNFDDLGFEEVETVEELTDALSDLYDWADFNRVLIK